MAADEGGQVQDHAQPVADDEPATNEDDVTELLVEEVSIDGLCGVY
jgi:mycofactocin precursor